RTDRSSTFVPDTALFRSPRVVDQQFHAAVARVDVDGELLEGLGVGHVEYLGLGLLPLRHDVVGDGGGPFGVDIGDHHPHPDGGRVPGQTLADPRTRAGDDGGAAGETFLRRAHATTSRRWVRMVACDNMSDVPFELSV